MEATSHALYESYGRMKGWTSEASPYDPAMFNFILQSASKKGSQKILEIGFGDGSFMDWARESGHEIVGIEILDEFVDAVNNRGHRAYPSIDAIPPSETFDLVVAIDVLEHLALDQFSGFLAFAKARLSDDGAIVARFPNGDSPFFGRYQYGDFTHDKPISARSVKQIIEPHGLTITKTLNPRPMPKSLLSKFKRRAAYCVRDLIEIVLGFVYFGIRTPMDPNVIIVIRRTSSPTGCDPEVRAFRLKLASP